MNERKKKATDFEILIKTRGKTEKNNTRFQNEWEDGKFVDQQRLSFLQRLVTNWRALVMPRGTWHESQETNENI